MGAHFCCTRLYKNTSTANAMPLAGMTATSSATFMHMSRKLAAATAENTHTLLSSTSTSAPNRLKNWPMGIASTAACVLYSTRTSMQS